MASRKPIVIGSDGLFQQLQAGDTLNATVSEVDVVSKTNDNAGSIVIGTPVYVKSNGNVDKARANATGTTKVLGLVRDSSISAAASGIIQTSGVLAATTGEWDTVTGGSGGLTAGSYYFLSSSTAGMLTATAPSSGGDFITLVGLAVSTTEMYINPVPPVKL